MIDVGQKETVLLCCTVMAILEDVHFRVIPSGMRDGVSYGGSLTISRGSSSVRTRRRCCWSVWPFGLTFAMTSKTRLGISVGVGTWLVLSRERRESNAIWKIKAGGVSIDDVTLRVSPP